MYAGAVKIVHCYYLTVIVMSQTVASCCQSDAAPPPHTAKCSSLKNLKLKNLIFKFNSGVSRKIRRTWDRPRPLHQLTLLVPVSHNLAFYTITRSCSQGAAPGTLPQASSLLASHTSTEPGLWWQVGSRRLSRND